MTNEQLELAGADLIEAAAAFAVTRLPVAQRDRTTVVIEVGKHASIELWQMCEAGLAPVACVAKFDESALELVGAAGVLAATWLNTLSGNTRRVISDAQARGCAILVAVEYQRGALSLSMRDSVRIVELATRIVREVLH